MTVQELIEALEKLPSTSKILDVVIEVSEGEIYGVLMVGEASEHGTPVVTLVSE